MSVDPSEINVSVTFRHTESTEALKSYATEKVLNCLQKYVSSPTEAHVVLSVQKRDHLAELRVTSKRFDLTASGSTGDLYSAIDKMVDAMTGQLRKQKERLVSHKQAGELSY